MTGELGFSSSVDEAILGTVGFRWGDRGTHTSRTIMLQELQALLSSCPLNASRGDYVTAIQVDNCLGKRTAATRRLSTQRLSELYALDPAVVLFRTMRNSWYIGEAGRPLLALLLALARDPLLRVTAPAILAMRPGEELSRQHVTEALGRSVGSRLSESTLDKVVRNASSSWTQSGHLRGRNRKVRQQVTPSTVAVAFALLLGYVAGQRGAVLFETLWAKALDAPPAELIHLAVDARRLGLLDMSQSGGVIEVTFSRALTESERR